MTTTATDTVELTVVVPVDHLEMGCTQADGRVATHEVVGPLPCRHVYCLEHADVLSRFLEDLRANYPGPRMWECASHHRIFTSDAADWRILPLRGARP